MTIFRAQGIPDLLPPEEIAAVILLLASEASRAITGQEILADRGWQHSSRNRGEYWQISAAPLSEAG